MQSLVFIGLLNKSDLDLLSPEFVPIVEPKNLSVRSEMYSIQSIDHVLRGVNYMFRINLMSCLNVEVQKACIIV